MKISNEKFYVLVSEDGGDSGEPVNMATDEEDEAVKEMTALLDAGASARGIEIYEIGLGEPGEDWEFKLVIG